MSIISPYAADFVEQGLGEEVHVRHLSNGMPILVVPKPTFRKKYALFGTTYGSIDNEFSTATSKVKKRMPAGIAHFLEHKMFEKEDGDVMDKLAEIGVSSNAMTSFNHTGYQVESTNNFMAGLEILLDFVTRPYFTPDLVDKEKGIIAEEINMYRDDSSWRGYMGVLELLFGAHPVAIDIAGTVESIQAVTAEDLYLCHRTFYSPTNMHLAVSGDVDPDAVVELAEGVAERNAHHPVDFKRFCPAAPKKPKRRRTEEVMAVALSKLHIGWRVDIDPKFASVFETELALEIFLSAVLAKSSPLYLELYDAGLIDDSFGYSASVEKEFAFVMMAGDVREPALLEKKLRQGIQKVLAEGLDAVAVRRAKRLIYGAFIRGLDSVSTACWNLIDCLSKDTPYLGYGKALMKLKTDKVEAIADRTFNSNLWAAHVITPMTVA